MTDLSPIERSVTVRCRVDHAFEVFTARMASWWPLAKHSVGEERTRDVVLEPRVGGRFYERTDDGEEHEWGQVLVWDPPSSLSYTWHPGRTVEEQTLVEMRFVDLGDGSTRVEVAHSGWERLGVQAEARRNNYTGDDAWPGVLGIFAGAAEAG
jgi:hypothetical protein